MTVVRIDQGVVSEALSEMNLGIFNGQNGNVGFILRLATLWRMK